MSYSFFNMFEELQEELMSAKMVRSSDVPRMCGLNSPANLGPKGDRNRAFCSCYTGSALVQKALFLGFMKN